jgi:hypothetical protein
VIWHIVRFDFTGVDGALRDDIEGRLRTLTSIDEVAFLRLARDIADDQVTGLITGFATIEDLDTYRVHPEHLPVVAAIREAGVATTRLDVPSDDDPAVLPR